MKKAIAMEWADLLESGMFKQGRGYLDDGNKQCCIGVLCNIAANRNICTITKEESRLKFDDNGGTAPDSVLEWSGLQNSQGAFINNNSRVLLTVLNDDKGKSFKEIAEIIRENYKKL
jgi:hypothetical protein